MKITKRQLRQLIESVINEQDSGYPDGVYFAGKRLFGKATHGFLITVKGSEIIGYHGGPGSYYMKHVDKSADEKSDALVTWSQPHSNSDIKALEDGVEPINLEIDNIDKAKSELQTALSEVKSKKLTYNLSGPNSNTTAWYLLSALGKKEMVDKKLKDYDLLFPGRDTNI